ncbi:DUF922 domain-containing protein [Arundinibacter roseus]|uniref:DUF922 domain-containing protein n=1 Tax=Arundinibacter roseus TaxID=2070510 RepID=A0A4R4KJB2_9BACT|nr:hypothetical protein [Arundinibacter roseus]TDB66972.1 hypothetical protein EZE20_07600 [Arundinibacter roseus]
MAFILINNRNWLRLLPLLLLFLVQIAGKAQSVPTANLQFQKEKIALANTRSYYVLDVIDKRKLKPNELGEINLLGKPNNLVIQPTLARALYDFWSGSTRVRNELSVPLEIILEDVSVSEKRIAPNKIAGELKVRVSFQWTRSMEPLHLTTYQSASTYTRPEGSYDHEVVFRRMLTGAIKHFDSWIGQNDGKNPLLARGVKLVFDEVDYAEKGDTVFYKPSRKLTWEDFQGSYNRPGSKYSAAVFSSLSYEGGSRMRNNLLEIRISLKVFMVKSMSWGRPEARNTYTLSHEQLHFDITRIVAERFKEKLKKMDLTIENYDSQIQYEFLETFRELNTEQEAYDGQTSHGLNSTQQAEWHRKIKAEIARIYQGT